MKKAVNFLLVAMLLLAIVSCKPNEGKDGSNTDYSTGVLISNEGMFQTGSGEISYYDNFTGEVVNNLFEKINNRVLGNVVQSVTRHGDYTMIVVNNSNKVEIVDSKTFKSIETIYQTTQPRYYIPISSNKGYLTSWNGKVYVIDLTTMTVSKEIETGKNGDRGVLCGKYVWIANSGGYVYDNTISVINTDNDEVTATITTEYNPNSIELDDKGNVWVLCGGNSYFDFTTNLMTYVTSPKLMCFDVNSFEKKYEYAGFNMEDYVFGLTINKDRNTLFMVKNGTIEAGAVSYSDVVLKELYTPSGSIYAIKMNPTTNKLFYSDAGDFNSNGTVVIIDPKSGNKETTFNVGIIPGGFDF